MAITAIAGGALAAGGLLGQLLTRPEERSPDDFNIDFGGQNQQLQDTISQLQDPSRNRQFFERLLEDRGPSRQDLLATAAATGGSQAAAVRQAQAQQRRTQDQIGRLATQQFMQQQGLLADLVGQQAQLQQQRQIGEEKLRQQLAAGSRRRRTHANQEMFGQLTTAGAGLLGQSLGAKFANQGAPNPTRQSLPGTIDPNLQDFNQGVTQPSFTPGFRG